MKKVLVDRDQLVAQGLVQVVQDLNVALHLARSLNAEEGMDAVARVESRHTAKWLL
jgi:hypothetical protein